MPLHREKCVKFYLSIWYFWFMLSLYFDRVACMKQNSQSMVKGISFKNDLLAVYKTIISYSSGTHSACSQCTLGQCVIPLASVHVCRVCFTQSHQWRTAQHKFLEKCLGRKKKKKGRNWLPVFVWVSFSHTVGQIHACIHGPICQQLQNVYRCQCCLSALTPQQTGGLSCQRLGCFYLKLNSKSQLQTEGYLRILLQLTFIFVSVLNTQRQ